MKISSNSFSGSMESDHSNILSLSSNNSDYTQTKYENQILKLKQKLQNLFNIHTNNLDELYFAIQKKFATKYYEQQLTELNKVLSNLGIVKKNNREMAKLVSSLGVKLKQKSDLKKKPTSQFDLHNNTQANPNFNSYDQYHFDYNPIKPFFNPSYEHSHNPRVKSFEEFQLNNRKYEEKILSILNELGNIKQTLNTHDAKFSSITQVNTSFPPSSEPQKKQTSQKAIQTSFQIKSPSSNQIKINKTHEQAEKYFFQNNQSQKALGNKARQISFRLEQIKQQIHNSTASLISPTAIPEVLPQRPRNTQNNSSSYKQQPSKQLNISNRHQQQPLQQIKPLSHNQIHKNCQKTDSMKQLSSQNSFPSIGSKQTQMKRKEKNQKSILDGMKNVQSQVIISDQKIQPDKPKQNFTTFKDTCLQEQSPKTHKKDCIIDHYRSQTFLNENFPKKQQNIKQIVISYSNMKTFLNQNRKNQSTLHNTSIMNPNQKLKKENSKQIQKSHNGQQLRNTFDKSSTNLIVEGPKNSKNYSRQIVHIFPIFSAEPHAYENDLLNRSISSQNLTVNVSLNNLQNRLLGKKYQQALPHYLSQSRFVNQNVPIHANPLVPVNLPQISKAFPHLIRPQSRKINPFQALNEQSIQNSSSIKTTPLLSQDSFYIINKNSNKSYETSGINLSLMKKSFYEQTNIQLGKSSKKLRDSSYSRDSKDSKQSRGLK